MLELNRMRELVGADRRLSDEELEEMGRQIYRLAETLVDLALDTLPQSPSLNHPEASEEDDQEDR